jgi:type IV pilus biogenesis protein PilP
MSFGKCVAAAVTCAAISACAQNKTLDDLAEANQRRMLIEAQIKQAESEKKLMDLRASINTTGSSATQSRPTQAPTQKLPPVSAPSMNLSQPLPPPPEKEPAPMVMFVEGAKGNLEALLVFKSGAFQRARVGDDVGSLKVLNISLRDVVLIDPKTKDVTRLQFASASSMIPQTGISGQQRQGF